MWGTSNVFLNVMSDPMFEVNHLGIVIGHDICQRFTVNNVIVLRRPKADPIFSIRSNRNFNTQNPITGRGRSFCKVGRSNDLFGRFEVKSEVVSISKFVLEIKVPSRASARDVT